MTSLVDTDNQSAKEFTFLQSLSIHSGTVRCLDVLDVDDSIISGSIDTSAK